MDSPEKFGAVAVVMPAYNERDGIIEFIDEIAEEIIEDCSELTVVVVDDASPDGTADAVEAHSPDVEFTLRCVRRQQNGGHGPTSLAAYRAGIESGADVILHTDGDGQYSGRDVARVLDPVATGAADWATGVRVTRADPWFRILIAQLLRVYVYVLTGVRLRDVNTPLRAYRRDVIEARLALVPETSAVPSIYLSVLDGRAGRYTRRNDTVLVTSMHRRGANTVGSMWGGGTKKLLPSRALVKFVGRCVRETATLLPRLRANARGPARTAR